MSIISHYTSKKAPIRKLIKKKANTTINTQAMADIKVDFPFEAQSHLYTDIAYKYQA